MTSATIEEVQAKLPELLQQLRESDELVIVEDGWPVARLTRIPLPKGIPILGRGRSKVTIISEDDDHLKDFEEYMP
jgi:antitoxin (DNA-binding transcriptional repressor) of toxin-antitoxin stability system